MDLQIDEEDLLYLDDRPSSYEGGKVYSTFEFVLPYYFVKVANPWLKEVICYYDDYNMEGIRLVFHNGDDAYTTELFGLQKDRRGTKTDEKKIYLSNTRPVETIERLMVNTKVSPNTTKHSGYYTVNLSFDDQKSLSVGYEDSTYAEDKALRDSLTETIGENYRIVGIHGTTRKAYGTLRSFNFILATGEPKADSVEEDPLD